jgi:hypothetical protein
MLGPRAFLNARFIAEDRSLELLFAAVRPRGGDDCPSISKGLTGMGMRTGKTTKTVCKANTDSRLADDRWGSALRRR